MWLRLKVPLSLHFSNSAQLEHVAESLPSLSAFPSSSCSTPGPLHTIEISESSPIDSRLRIFKHQERPVYSPLTLISESASRPSTRVKPWSKVFLKGILLFILTYLAWMCFDGYLVHLELTWVHLVIMTGLLTALIDQWPSHMLQYAYTLLNCPLTLAGRFLRIKLQELTSPFRTTTKSNYDVDSGCEAWHTDHILDACDQMLTAKRLAQVAHQAQGRQKVAVEEEWPLAQAVHQMNSRRAFKGGRKPLGAYSPEYVKAHAERRRRSEKLESAREMWVAIMTALRRGDGRV